MKSESYLGRMSAKLNSSKDYIVDPQDQI